MSPDVRPDVTPDVSPVLLTDDELLRAEVVRLAAAGGVYVEVARESSAALQRWSEAPLVLIGADRVAAMARLRPPRRGGVHVLGRAPLSDLLFREALAVGAESVAELPTSETWLVELLTDVGDGMSTPGVTIGVLAGCGGAGASTFAAALGHAAARHGPALVVDADLMGPGIDRVLGMERVDGIRWDSLMHATGRLSARSLRESLPRAGALNVLSWPLERPGSLPPFAVREVLSAGRRGYDTVVVDIPRHPGSVNDEILARCDHVVLVSTLTVPAVAAAGRTVARIPSSTRRHLVTRGGACGISPEEVARVLGIGLLAAMSDQRRLDEAISLGAGPSRSSRGALARTARAAADRLLEQGRAVA